MIAGEDRVIRGAIRFQAERDLLNSARQRSSFPFGQLGARLAETWRVINTLGPSEASERERSWSTGALRNAPAGRKKCKRCTHLGLAAVRRRQVLQAAQVQLELLNQLLLRVRLPLKSAILFGQLFRAS